MTVIIPTLSADAALDECVHSLSRQTLRDFDCIIVDNSGRNLVRGRFEWVRVIENSVNVGFGKAINQGIDASTARFIATLNDDAIAEPEWLTALVHAAESGLRVGMCASQVRLLETGALDSAGMLICGDGSSKQRGHGGPPEDYPCMEAALLPSGSAALYRRKMLEEVHGFDEDFFLYCEDTDLGLRGQWAGWNCVYASEAIVHHRYSHSAGRASALKAYYVERNRLYLVVKTFPISLILVAPFVAVTRYLWHICYLLQGRGAAAAYRQESSGASLIWLVLKAHWAMIANIRPLWRKRRAIRAAAQIDSREFASVLHRYAISAKQVAAL